MMLEAYFYKKNIAEILKNVIESKGDNTFNYTVSPTPQRIERDLDNPKTERN